MMVRVGAGRWLNTDFVVNMVAPYADDTWCVVDSLGNKERVDEDAAAMIFAAMGSPVEHKGRCRNCMSKGDKPIQCLRDGCDVVGGHVDRYYHLRTEIEE